jgi:siroheme synthase (precorrin-2 oxidase/ferrochelatase)
MKVIETLLNFFLIYFTLFIINCSFNSNQPKDPNKKNKTTSKPLSDEVIEQEKGKRFKERTAEQIILNRALSSLDVFDGDGQLRFVSGGYNGSVFFYNKSVIMTNKHVVKGRSLSDLEYISFPRLVFYRSDRERSVKNYIKERLERIKKDKSIATQILQTRINNLKKLSDLNDRLKTILHSYQGDLELLKKQKMHVLNEIAFIPINQAIEEIWTRSEADPDIALIVLKHPVDKILSDSGSPYILNEEMLAENSPYNQSNHGLIYAGTPLYSANYGREFQGSPIDKNRSLTVVRSGFLQHDDTLVTNLSNRFNEMWKMEHEFYYFSDFFAPGASGSRIWVYLDDQNKIATTPTTLDAKKISIGITTAGNGGIFLTKEILEPFKSKLNKLPVSLTKSVTLVRPLVLDYLLSFKARSQEDFIDRLTAYFFYQEEIANLDHKLEEEYLWWVAATVLYRIYGDIEIGGSYLFEFRKAIRKASKDYFEKNPTVGHSAIKRKDWIEIILNSKRLNNEQKKLFEKLSKGAVFEDLGASVMVHLQYINEPLSSSLYLQTINDWVENKKYNRNNYFSTVKPEKKDFIKIFKDIDELKQSSFY